MKLSVFPSSIETSRALILRLVEIMNEEPDRVFNIAVSGGNTPALMFDLWANEYMEITPWDRMRIYWVDERCVPPDDSDSNYGMMRNLLLGITPIPVSYTHLDVYKRQTYIRCNPWHIPSREENPDYPGTVCPVRPVRYVRQQAKFYV